MTTDEFLEHQHNYDGYCTECQEWTTGGVEPDATGYSCEMCGAESSVVGADEVLIQELIEIE